MIRIDETTLILFAAGRAERFGGGKLAADLGGVPLGLHAARTLAALPFRERIAVVGADTPDFVALGYRVLVNADPARDMASSVRMGVAAAGGAAVLLALADMPCITETHVRRLFEAAEGPKTVVASTDGARPCPPALFGRRQFRELLALTGDRGARDLIARGVHVTAPPGALVDVDTPEDLGSLRDTFTRLC
ncbi:nucleotidyltransferase family protein [Sphingomonas sp.]|uniref:nucleotidyltransferase family protein n=1 Tax=Sphingomonas sp. TaxID=28214 RepID=UPI0035C8521E